MFSGIIEKTAAIEEIRNGSLVIKLDGNLGRVDIGESISVDGVCLTVTQQSKGFVGFDVMPETVKRTIIATYKKGQHVNIERSLPVNGRISGHFVQGHVDCKAKCLRARKDRDTHVLYFEMPRDQMHFVVEKGSIAINGISLTVIGCEFSRNTFWVGIIPHTWDATNLKELKIGSHVNIEVDIIAKYIYHFTYNVKRPL